MCNSHIMSNWSGSTTYHMLTMTLDATNGTSEKKTNKKSTVTRLCVLCFLHTQHTHAMYSCTHVFPHTPYKYKWWLIVYHLYSLATSAYSYSLLCWLFFNRHNTFQWPFYLRYVNSTQFIELIYNLLLTHTHTKHFYAYVELQSSNLGGLTKLNRSELFPPI